jgi:predicted MFS family arabinose efflux permease
MGTAFSLAAGAFLPVFLTRLGASNLQVGLLTAMPGVTGFFLAIVAGRFLQTRRNIMPWFSIVRLLNAFAYTLTGLVPFLVPREYVVVSILAVWALVTIPQTLSGIAFSVVMSAVAGPRGRLGLMSRRWSLMGLLNATTVAIIGQVLDSTAFPVNYQLVFVTLSLGGLVSFFGTRQVRLPDREPPPRKARTSLRSEIAEYVSLVRNEKAFVSFALKRFVFISGMLLAGPLFPLYLVRDVQASDSWIGIISTTQTAVTLVGYYLWTRVSRARGSRFVLLSTTLVIALYPLLVGLTRQVGLIVVMAGIAGMFQAGLNLVFFDELMKTVPPEEAPTFVSLAQNLRYISVVIGPMLGTALADRIGLSGGLFVGAAVRFLGFALFALGKRVRLTPAAPSGEAQGTT